MSIVRLSGLTESCAALRRELGTAGDCELLSASPVIMWSFLLRKSCKQAIASSATGIATGATTRGSHC